jgi:hypothetical protein
VGKLTVKTGSTSRLEHVFILDSTSTTGAGKTGLTNASVTMHFFRPADATVTPVTLSAGTLGTWTTGGFKEVSATDMPGLYEIGMPNAVFAATFNHSVVMIKGTGIAPVVLEYDLVSYDPLDTVRLGLTALPNTAVTTNGSLITAGVGTAQLSLASGFVTTGTISNGAITSATFGTGAITSTVLAADAINATVIANGAIDAATFATGAINAAAIAADALTSAKFQDGALIIGATTGTGVKISHGVNSITAGVIANGAIDAAAFAAGAIDAAAIATNAIDADALATDAVTEIVNAIMVIDPSSFTVGTSGYWIYQAGTNAQNAASNTSTLTGTPYVESIGDALLNRNIAGGSNTGRLVKEALYALRNKTEISGAQLNVYNATDGAIAWSATVSSSAAADPITGIDPP